jgi:hypothetical protein
MHNCVYAVRLPAGLYVGDQRVQHQPSHSMQQHTLAQCGATPLHDHEVPYMLPCHSLAKHTAASKAAHMTHHPNARPSDNVCCDVQYAVCLPAGLYVCDQWVQHQASHSMQQHTLAQCGAPPRCPSQVDGRLHVHKRQRHKLSDAASASLWQQQQQGQQHDLGGCTRGMQMTLVVIPGVCK